MEQTNFDKASILKRITQVASRILHTEFPLNLDPFVRLSLEAIASEIYLLEDSAANIESRLLEKLASVLIPAAKTTALPAHAIFSAQPIEAEYMMEENCSVYYEDFFISKKYNINCITFFPAVQARLKKANIRYLIGNGKCFALDTKGNREFIGKLSNTDLTGKVWIGLDIDTSVTTLEGLSFYWDFPGTPRRNEYIQLPESSLWSINGQKVQTNSGIIQTAKNNLSVLESLSDKNVSNTISREVYNYYKPQFVTITDCRSFNRTCCPEELSDRITSPVSLLGEQLDTPLLWIQVHFPPMIPDYVLEQCIVFTNAFPIIQKSLNKLVTKQDELKNIIPLKMQNNEHFLSVESVYDSQGKAYQELADKDYTGEISGSYSVRHGGCERFDSRDAKAYLDRLEYLLTEDLAAFHSLSKEDISEITREMQILLERMKRVMEGISDKGDILNYLIIDSPALQEFMSVNYWTTNAEIGNGIPAGKSLVPYPDTAINPQSAFLVTASSGGRKALNIQEKVICFRNVLTTRGRIFTKDDIASFCMATYPGIISSVEVKHGIMQGRTTRKSLLRTIDVCLHFSGDSENYLDKKELSYSLERKLKACSPETFNYRIII